MCKCFPSQRSLPQPELQSSRAPVCRLQGGLKRLKNVWLYGNAFLFWRTWNSELWDHGVPGYQIFRESYWGNWVGLFLIICRKVIVFCQSIDNVDMEFSCRCTSWNMGHGEKHELSKPHRCAMLYVRGHAPRLYQAAKSPWLWDEFLWKTSLFGWQTAT